MNFLSEKLLIVTATAVPIILVLLIYYLNKPFNYWKSRNVPFVKPTFIFGNLKDVVLLKHNIGILLGKMCETMNQPFFGIWFFNKPCLIVSDPEIIKNMLVKDFQHFQDRTIHCDPKIDNIGSKFLFVMRNPEWKTLRTQSSPIFTCGKLKNMVSLINEAGAEMKDYLSMKSVIETKEVAAKFTTDVISSCAFGVKAQCFHNEDAEFRVIGRKMFEKKIRSTCRGMAYFFAHFIVKLFRIKFFASSVYDFFRQIFIATIKQRIDLNLKRHDLINIMIESKMVANIDDLKVDEEDAVVAHGIQFFVGGFETTSSTIAFTLFELCLNTDIQERLRREIKEVTKTYNGLNYEAIANMPYLDKVIKEALRKYPSLPFLDRMCTEDYKIPNTDVIIEKGTQVFIPMFGLHYNSKYFSEPEKFDPERFTDENVKSRPTHCYIPFGSGPRTCIGERFGIMTTKLGICTVINNFRVEPTEDTPLKIDFLVESFLLHSKVGVPLRLVKLNGD